jgi:hypothetical protein
MHAKIPVKVWEMFFERLAGAIGDGAGSVVIAG